MITKKTPNEQIDTIDLADFALQHRSSHLAKDRPRPKDAVFIIELTIKPRSQRRVPLGSFTEKNSPRGFLVEIDPDPSPADSVVTEVTSLNGGNRRTLFLEVANFSSRVAHAQIWRL
jgi:hypothetical protein